MTCDDPARMLEWLRVMRPARPNPDRGDVRTTDRRLRLWACAVCRQVWHLLTDPRSRRAVEVAERYADGLATAAERNAAYQAASDAAEEADAAGNADAFALAVMAQACVRKDVEGVIRARRVRVPPVAQAALLRDVVGNPFRPVTIDPRVLTPAVTGFARVVYEWGDWQDLPVLADLLAEAGCVDAALLGHLRQPSHVHGPQCSDRDGLWCAWQSVIHARGCWAVDLILGQP